MNLMNEILFYLITFVKNYSIQYSKSFFRSFFFDLIYLFIYLMIIYLMIYTYKTKLISLKIFYLEHIFYKELLDISKIKT